MVRQERQSDPDSDSVQEEIRLQKKLIAESKSMLHKNLSTLRLDSSSDSDTATKNRQKTKPTSKSPSFVKAKVKTAVASSSDDSSDSEVEPPKMISQPDKKKQLLTDKDLLKKKQMLMEELKKLDKKLEHVTPSLEGSVGNRKGKFSRLSVKKTPSDDSGSSDTNSKKTPLKDKARTSAVTPKAQTMVGLPLKTSTPNASKIFEVAKLSTKKDLLHQVLDNSQKLVKPDLKHKHDKHGVDSESEDFFPLSQGKYMKMKQNESKTAGASSDEDSESEFKEASDKNRSAAKDKTSVKNVSFNMQSTDLSRSSDKKKGLSGILKKAVAHKPSASDSDKQAKPQGNRKPASHSSDSDSSSDEEPEIKTNISKNGTAPKKMSIKLENDTSDSDSDESPRREAKTPPKSKDSLSDSDSEQEEPVKITNKSKNQSKVSKPSESSSDSDNNDKAPNQQLNQYKNNSSDSDSEQEEPVKITNKSKNQSKVSKPSESSSDSDDNDDKTPNQQLNQSKKLPVKQKKADTSSNMSEHEEVQKKNVRPIAKAKPEKSKPPVKKVELSATSDSDEDFNISKIKQNRFGSQMHNKVIAKTTQFIQNLKKSAGKSPRQFSESETDSDAHNRSARVINAVVTPPKKQLVSESESKSEPEISPIKKGRSPKPAVTTKKPAPKDTSESESEDDRLPEVINKNVSAKKVEALETAEPRASDSGSSDSDEPEPPRHKRKRHESVSASEAENMTLSQTIDSLRKPDVVDADPQLQLADGGRMYDCLKELLLSQPGIKPMPVSTRFMLSQLGPHNEVWLTQCPRDVRPEDLVGQTLVLEDGARSKLRVGSDRYECVAQRGSQRDLCLLASADRNAAKLAARIIKPVGTVVLHRLLGKQRTSTSVPAVSDISPGMPDNLKVRHPIFGADFQDKIEISGNTLQKLIDAEVVRRKYDAKAAKKRKKSKKGAAGGRGERSPLEPDEPDSSKNEMIFRLLNKAKGSADDGPDDDKAKRKKAKKRKQEQEQGAGVELTGRRADDDDAEPTPKKKKKKKKGEPADPDEFLASFMQNLGCTEKKQRKKHKEPAAEQDEPVTRPSAKKSRHRPDAPDAPGSPDDHSPKRKNKSKSK